uniref:C2H2-type domain-containing protein n=1 Tax=Oryzias sinensis TaxID=183150 RepID=A0A8C7Z5U0_9TELE
MSSLQSLREFISQRLAAAAEEIFRHFEGTIVQYEQQLCCQRLLAVRKPQLQLHHIVLPQRDVTEDEDLCNQNRNFRVEQEEPEPPQIKNEQEEPEPPKMKEDQEGLCISQDMALLDLKRETETLMEILTYKENENSEADLNNQHSFNVTDVQYEEGNQHEESTSTTDEVTDPQNRDQRKRRDRSHVQSVDSSHMSERPFDSDFGKNTKKASLIRDLKRSPKGNRRPTVKSGESSILVSCHVDKEITESDRIHYVCKECGKRFGYWSLFRIHMRTHTGEKPFSCQECDKGFREKSCLKRHMRTHTGEKPFPSKECDKSFSDGSNLKSHMKNHRPKKPFSCKN